MTAAGEQGHAGEGWTCGKPGCDLGVDGHDFALALEHIFHEEGMSAEDARGVADRTLDRVARGLGLDTRRPPSPGSGQDS